MTHIVSYARESLNIIQQNIAFPAIGGIATAIACHRFGIPLFTALPTSFLVVPLIISASITAFSKGDPTQLQFPLYSKSYAIGMLGIAMILQRSLYFLPVAATIGFWLVPKILVLKIGYDLFSKLEGLEFREKSIPPPKYTAP